MVSTRTLCTPLRVCTPSPCFQICGVAITDVKCNCAGSPHFNWHTPNGQPKDAVHSPTSVRTIPLAAQQVPSLLLVASATVLVHRDGQPNDAVHSPQRLHAHHSPPHNLGQHLPVWATVIKCNCVGLPDTNWHTPYGQPKDAVHSPASVHTTPCLPMWASRLLVSRATKDIFNMLKIFWPTVSGEPLAVKHALSTHHLTKSLSRQGMSSTWSIWNKECSTDQNTDAHCKHRILKGQTCPVSTAKTQFDSASNIKMIKATQAVTNALCKLSNFTHSSEHNYGPQ